MKSHTIVLNINDEMYSVTVRSADTLLYVLRGRLGLTELSLAA